MASTSMSLLCRRVFIPAAASAKSGTLTGCSQASYQRSFSYKSQTQRGRQVVEVPPGLDWQHWVIVTDPLKGATRNQIIDNYVKTLAKAVGSEEEARKRIYSVCTQFKFSQFGANIPEELTPKLQALPNVHFVLPDSYENPETKDYGGEPFVNGEAVPYDPKYYDYYLNVYMKKRYEMYNKNSARPSNNS